MAQKNLILKNLSLKKAFNSFKRKNCYSHLEDQTQEKGFSLIEVCISMALIAFFMTGTVELIVQALRVKKQAETNIKEASFLVAKLEGLKSLPYESDELQAGSWSDSVQDAASQETFRREWEVEDVTTEIKSIAFEIYSENKPQKKTRLFLLLSRELGF